MKSVGDFVRVHRLDGMDYGRVGCIESLKIPKRSDFGRLFCIRFADGYGTIAREEEVKPALEDEFYAEQIVNG
jgi:hypothetical protein